MAPDTGLKEDYEDKIDLLACNVCVESFDTNDEFEDHKTLRSHRIKWLGWQDLHNRQSLVNDKNNVEIIPASPKDEYDESLGTFTVEIEKGMKRSVSLAMMNAGDAPVVLYAVDVLNVLAYSSEVVLHDEHDVCRGSRQICLRPGSRYEVSCNIEAGCVSGGRDLPVVFQMKMKDTQEIFFISRILKVIVQGDDYSGPIRLISTQVRGNYIPGLRLEGRNEQDFLRSVKRVKEYPVPIILRNAIGGRNAHDALLKCMSLGEELILDNYKEWFDTLLWLERLQAELDIQVFNQECATLSSVEWNGESCVELLIEGLSEGRPSVIVRDSIYIAKWQDIDYAEKNGVPATYYEGVVHRVNQNSVYLAPDLEFFDDFYEDMEVSVEFGITDYPERVCHRALEDACLAEDRLFPTSPFSKLTPHGRAPQMWNTLLNNNELQIQAIRHILSGSSHPAPYIVFGPPGTGKTVTIVEAIKQVIDLKPGARVLACAPSNCAADLVCERLLDDLSSADVLRLNAKSRSLHVIKRGTHKYVESSCVNEQGVYYPSISDIKSKSIIVCTLVTAGRLVSADFPINHFTHLFLDEIGQAKEPEALIPLTGLINNDCHVILAGDPYQLGPVVRNADCMSGKKLFRDNGLDMSYLERLMKMELYSNVDGNHNPSLVTKLTKNYRSNRQILAIPNELFYSNELEICGDKKDIEMLRDWKYLPKPGFPLIFHNVEGVEMKEGKSPSNFNLSEIECVIDYVDKLLKSKGVKGEHIGIITPYRLQVQKIRHLIKDKYPHNSQSIKVGSPEEFQGDERKIIIISTVRASKDQLIGEFRNKLGFLRNPKRFNVAVTRAMSILILIGSAKILEMDKHWGALIEYITTNGGATEKTRIPRANHNLEDIEEHFENLDISPTLSAALSQLEEIEAPIWDKDY